MIKNETIKSTIRIGYGDLLAQTGMIAITVNDFFDSEVHGTIVSPNSVHGQFMNRFWRDNESVFDGMVQKSLKDQSIDAVRDDVVRKHGGKRTSYPIGSVAGVKQGSREFICAALTQVDPDTNQANSDVEMLVKAIRGVLNYARTYGNGGKLSFPLMGDGLSRTGLSKMFLLNLLIQMIVDENKKCHVADEFTILLHPSAGNVIDLGAIMHNWQ